jgi:cobalamin biosynthesis protein CobT
MPLEVAGERPGGNNQNGFNDDGPCLEQAAGLLRQRPENKKILIVISDGVPAGRRSDESDLQRAIAQIQKEGSIYLFGIGLGPGTTHVRKFYPNHKAEVQENRMATEIGNLILEHAVGDDVT